MMVKQSKPPNKKLVYFAIVNYVMNLMSSYYRLFLVTLHNLLYHTSKYLEDEINNTIEYARLNKHFIQYSYLIFFPLSLRNNSSIRL